jgi:hypothetical protein
VIRSFFEDNFEAKLRSEHPLKKARKQLIHKKLNINGHKNMVSEYILLAFVDLSMPLQMLP